MPVGRGGGELGLSPHAINVINPSTPTQRHFVLSPVSLASRDQDDGPVELNDRHLRSHLFEPDMFLVIQLPLVFILPTFS